MEMNSAIKLSGQLIINALVTALLYFMIVAFISYLLERWQYERSLRMTREEVKEEYKEVEGDPRVKSRIRTLQLEAARRRMMQEVPKATVVITNPTHIAVALKYEEKMIAPKITAKGAGIVAEKIKEIAEAHGVPVVEDRPLARALFKHDLDTFIPEELYVAVAKILAYIYKLRGKV
jgi:flagellar biosynthetic protein FlhB